MDIPLLFWRMLAGFCLCLCFMPAWSFPVAGGEFVSDQLIVEIAERTMQLEQANRKTTSSRKNEVPPSLEQRSQEVGQFMQSMGGDNWLKGWLKKFGRPRTIEEHTFATLVGISDKELGYYYIRSAPVSKEQMTLLSCNGPRLKDSPTMKAFCALAQWNASIVFNDLNALAEFRKGAAWFLANQDEGRWLWSIDVPSRGLVAPWLSCLSQSLGISVLLREYQLEQDRRYLDAAQNALGWMSKSLDKGGCAYSMPNGVWYEEYPDAKSPSHVLNGHMWALFGIWDFYRVTGDPSAKRMFDDGTQDNRVDLVEGNYQAFIIEQLKVLHHISRNPALVSYIQRWERSMNGDRGFVELAAREFLKARTNGPT